MKIIHILCAVLTISGFVYRAYLKLWNPQRLSERWLRITPHIVDTILLLSAIYLVIAGGFYPIWFNWTAAKLTGLVGYILFGLMTLRFARSRTAVLMSFMLALLSFAYIVAVARTKQAWPIML